MEENPYKAANRSTETTATSGRSNVARAVVLIVSAGLGVLLWAGLPVLVGEEEAWDSEWYWPCVMAVSFLLGCLQPRRAWQPVAALMFAQMALFVIQVTFRPAAFAPLGFMFMAVFSAVNLAVAYTGAGIVRLSQKLWQMFSGPA